jgi:Ca2+-binding EF-hand superfamily protein
MAYVVYHGKKFVKFTKLEIRLNDYFSRLFKIMDDNGNKKLEFEEFRKGVTEYGLSYSKDEIREIFNIFDKDRSGTIDFEEFLERLSVSN